MKFSLIVATVGRFDEVDQLFSSFETQEYKDFEVILVDQNPKGFLGPIVEKYKNSFPIKYINVNFKGLSRARNVGLKYVTGDVVAFPDDDCKYFFDTLKLVNDIFCEKSVDVITAKETNDNGYILSKKQCSKINKYNIWKCSISFTIFMKTKTCKKVGNFDEDLGVGSGTKYGSGEETDYLLRALECGEVLIHVADIKIFHPKNNFLNYKKAQSYSIGRMYVLKKHKYNIAFTFLNIVYPLLKIVLCLFSKSKIKFYWYQFMGRVFWKGK